MALYERQQFDFLLQTAVERFVERLEQRFRGPSPAREQLQLDPEGEGVWLSKFTAAVFEDFLLNNVDGACFVLRALPRQPVELTTSPPQTVEVHLVDLAQRSFARLLRAKSLELLEQHAGYEPIQTEG